MASNLWPHFSSNATSWMFHHVLVTGFRKISQLERLTHLCQEAATNGLCVLGDKEGDIYNYVGYGTSIFIMQSMFTINNHMDKIKSSWL